jgi:hypothetical protein
MSTNLEILYREMFGKLAQAPGSWRSTELCAFAGLKGRKYKGDLFVVGQAPNDWRNEWTADDLVQSDFIHRLVDDLLSPECPLAWVSGNWGVARTTKYNTRRSAFWRVVRQVVHGLSIANIDEDSWCSYIAWSDLYKISPSGGGRNPTETLCDAQFESCVKILKEEISLLRPGRILFLTGINWAHPFLKELGFLQESSITDPVEAASGILAGSRAVVLPHPRGKSEQQIVKAAVECLCKN